MNGHDVDDYSDSDFVNYPPRYSGGNREKQYKCYHCNALIVFKSKVAHNADGTRHLCKSKKSNESPAPPPQQATLFAMAAMNAIIGAQIQAGGVDEIHRMNFYDIADASWRVARAMVEKEKVFSDEF